jgi:hypothetical protein
MSNSTVHAEPQPNQVLTVTEQMMDVAQDQLIGRKSDNIDIGADIGYAFWSAISLMDSGDDINAADLWTKIHTECGIPDEKHNSYQLALLSFRIAWDLLECYED